MSTENRPEELAELQSRAFWALEHAEQLEPQAAVSDFRPMLRLWHYPAFFDYTCWIVFKPASRKLSDARLIVREVVWERTHDLQRGNPLEWLRQGFRAPPTIHVRDGELSHSQLSLFLEELARLPVPVAGIEVPWGLDGETFGFENCESGFLCVRLEWWCDGPAEWKAFTDCVARLRGTLQRCVSGEAYEA